MMKPKLFSTAGLRQSVRSYTEKPVPREILNRCVEAAGIAPSANNCQPWHFIVVDEPELVRQVAEATFSSLVSFNKFTVHAKAMTVVLAETPNLITQIGGALRKVQYQLLDVGMAVENFCLQAAYEGIGSCILGWFRDKKIKELLSIPRKEKIALLIALGYPADETIREKKRKDPASILSYNRYGG